MTQLSRLLCKRHCSFLLKMAVGVCLFGTGAVVLKFWTGFDFFPPVQMRISLTDVKVKNLHPKPFTQHNFISRQHLDPIHHPFSRSGTLKDHPPTQAKQAEPDRRTTVTNSSQTRMLARLSLAKDYCSKRTTPTLKTKNQPLCSPRHHSEFCIIGKVASTFWTRFYKTLRDSPSTHTLPSPYDLPLSTSERCGQGLPAEAGEDRPVVNAMFARDPFSRMFSAYVDKLVPPNPYFWRAWGQPAMSMDQRGGDSGGSVHCGEAVTFRQFFHYVVKQLHKTDVHVMPVSSQCDPCQEHYDVIGHLETFSDDLHHLMSLLNVTFRSGVSISRDSKLDAIFDSVYSPFRWKRNILNCISSQDMGKRIWRKLQIRGLISNRIDYPLGDTDLTLMTAERFNDIAVDAHQKSTDGRELSLQKKQAFVEALRSVAQDDLQEFVRLYADDFQAFGYDKVPELAVGLNGGFEDSKAFDYKQKWRMPKVG